jgi:hypothetical protein
MYHNVSMVYLSVWRVYSGLCHDECCQKSLGHKSRMSYVMSRMNTVDSECRTKLINVEGTSHIPDEMLISHPNVPFRAVPHS